MKHEIILSALLIVSASGCASTCGQQLQQSELTIARAKTLASIQRVYGDKLIPPCTLSQKNRHIYADIVSIFAIADGCLAQNRRADADALYCRILKKYPKGHQASAAHDMLTLLRHTPTKTQRAEQGH